MDENYNLANNNSFEKRNYPLYYDYEEQLEFQEYGQQMAKLHALL